MKMNIEITNLDEFWCDNKFIMVGVLQLCL